MTLLEKVNSMKMPFAELKGIAFIEPEKDRVVARMLVRPDLCTLHHTIHGGAVMAFADSVGGGGDRDQSAGGRQRHHHDREQDQFHRRRQGGNHGDRDRDAGASRGRRTQVWQTRLETEEGKLVAIVTQTQMVL